MPKGIVSTEKIHSHWPLLSVDLETIGKVLAHLKHSSLVPTGTCVNNTSVMMFKKGSFEIGGTIYPVAIKVLLS